VAVDGRKAMTAKVLVLAALGGALPALTWLWFWLREDAKHPEPKRRIALAFVGGTAAVLIVLPLQTYTYNLGLSVAELFTLWAFFEEFIKLAVCYLVALRSKDDDEPVDVLIYMITTALGFAAFENALFLINPLMEGSLATSIVTGNLRFIGASLLHVISSGAIGAFIALSFYRSKILKTVSAMLGLSVAVVLHTYFNLFIIRETNSIAFTAFGAVWLAIIVLMLLFEKVKTINPRK
jgi:protease PrsW